MRIKRNYCFELGLVAYIFCTNLLSDVLAEAPLSQLIILGTLSLMFSGIYFSNAFASVPIRQLHGFVGFTGLLFGVGAYLNPIAKLWNLSFEHPLLLTFLA